MTEYNWTTLAVATNISTSTSTAATTTTTTLSPHVSVTGVAFPHSWVLATTSYLSILTIFSAFTNVLLIAIIFSSPNLKTPPNNHLVNICVNDLLICLTMLLSICTMNMPPVFPNLRNTFAFVNGLLTRNTLLQYSTTFAAIGHYRYKTVLRPILSLKSRRRLIKRSLFISWISSVSISLAFSLAFMKDIDNPLVNMYPFFSIFSLPKESTSYNTEQFVMMYVIFIAFLVSILFMMCMYYRIGKSIRIKRTTISNNRVSPWNRTNSVDSNATDFTTTKKPNTDNPNRVRPFIVSDHFVVQYQQADNSVNTDEIFALEYPKLSTDPWSAQRRNLTATLSADSTASAPRSLEFSDITATGELQRFQNIKNRSALKMQSAKNERVGLNSATKNTFIMFAAFLSCSFALFVCGIPGVLSSDIEKRMKTLLISNLVFCFNSLIYPTWFLMFSKRVKKCVGKMVDNVLSELYIRR